ncbi:MAG: PEP-CTERM sorting domain-containing protein [Acetobacteraceae bacterium]
MAKSTAATSGGIIVSLTGTASMPVANAGESSADVENGTAPLSSTYNAFAVGRGLANYGGLGPHVGAVFNASGTTNFGTAVLGGLYNAEATGSVTLTDSMAWVINPSSLPTGSGHTLDLGLVDGLPSGAGFTSLTFDLFKQGSMKLKQTFTSVSAADTYFTDDLVPLGQWNTGVSGNLDIEATLSETLASAGSGYLVDFMVGVDPLPGSAALPKAVPEPAAVSLFGLGLGGLGWVRRRRSAKSR